MTYAETVSRLTLETLRRRATAFAAEYVPERPTVILIPAGMGSRFLKTDQPFIKGRKFAPEPTYTKVWHSLGGTMHGKLDELTLSRSGVDRGNRPVIASGELPGYLAKKYDDTRRYFDSTLPANYALFGYDWRKMPREGAAYLRQFLRFLAEEVKVRDPALPDPRPNITLLAHGLGGLVGKMLLNDLEDSGEDGREWLDKLITVGTPFYGTQTHLSRYYKGVEVANLFNGGAEAVARLIAGFPGPYMLLPAPSEVLTPRFEALGLTRYPVVDLDRKGVAADPFSKQMLTRYPRIMTRPNATKKFTMARLAAAAAEFAEIDRELPTFRDRIFHIRSNKDSSSSRSVRIFWKKVSASFLHHLHPDPIQVERVRKVTGYSDGVVPEWSSALPWVPKLHVTTLSGLTHSGLAEHRHVLDSVVAIMRNLTPIAPPMSIDLPCAQPEEVMALVEQIRAGERDVDDLVGRELWTQRGFETLLEMV